MKSFDGKVAAITGAGSGIGRALAIDLAKRRCDVALSDVDEKGLEGTASTARAHGVRVTVARVDVAEREAVHVWADQVAREHGKVNMVFNNAGVSLASTLEGGSYEDFEWIMNINFWGVVHGTKAFLPHLHASGDGHVVNVSSLFGIIAAPGNGMYNATKFAVRGFTEALRQELELSGASVTATSVHPGGVKTNIARSSRMSGELKSKLGDGNHPQRFEKMFITTPDRAAEIILAAVLKNRRRVLVGPDAVALDLMARFSPVVTQKFTLALARRMVNGR